MNSTSEDRLELRWLPVLDGAGRTRMEASWVVVPAHTPDHAVNHAA